MSLIKGKYRIKNSMGVYETVHLETMADQVYFENEKTLQEMLDSGEIGGAPENVKTIMQSTQPYGQYQGRVWIQLTEDTSSSQVVLVGQYLTGQVLCGQLQQGGDSVLTGNYLVGEVLCGQNPTNIIGMKRR